MNEEMTSPTNNTIGLTVPGRSSTPCDGTTQYFRRLGDPSQQMTRTFQNGTTITFGTSDPISIFGIDDPFYEQVQSIQLVEKEILEIRRKSAEAGIPSQSTMCGGKRVAELDGHGGICSTSSSVQGFVAEPRLDPTSHRMGASQEAHELDRRLSTESQSRHHGKPSLRDRRNRDYSHTSRFLDDKTCNESGRLESVVRQGLIAKNPAKMLPRAPAIQFNSFGASIPDMPANHGSVSASQNQIQSAVRKNKTQKSAMQKRAEEISLHGCYLKSQHSSLAPAAARNTTSQMVPASSGLMLQHPINTASHRQEPFSMQMVRSDFCFNGMAAAQSFSATQQRIMVPFPVPGFRDEYFPNPDYYGPKFYMTAMQKDRIMSANGIKLPAIYRPDDRYYHGPLHFFVPPVAATIVAYVESTNPPPLPTLPCHSMNTMLAPYGVPPEAHIPGLSQEEIHVKECVRHFELMKEVLAVPGYINHGEEPIIWYRILSSSYPRSQQPVWHPAVIDLYGREEQYEHLLMRDINFRNNNVKGVGRPGNRLYREIAVFGVEIEQEGNTGDAQDYQNTPVTTHDRTESEAPVIFRDFRPNSDVGATYQYLGYALKSKRYEEPNSETSPIQHSRERSTKSSGRKIPFQVREHKSACCSSAIETCQTETPKRTHSDADKPSTGNTPMLDFDRKYTEEHGEGEDVDFALRDLGPPKIQGKTFNQAIGFTPSPLKGTGSSAPFGYPMNFRLNTRD